MSKRETVEARNDRWLKPLPVGEGWRELVEEAVAWANREGVVISTVKEKFGGLRIYHDGDEDSWGLFDEIEARSYETCEFCGRAGGPMRRGPYGWVKTICKECAGAQSLGRAWEEVAMTRKQVAEAEEGSHAEESEGWDLWVKT